MCIHINPFQVKMATFSNFRSEFLLDSEVIFLNHGSFGATPTPVFSKYQEWQRKLENQPVQFLGRNSADLLYQSRAELANYLGCSSNELVFVPNTTVGLNIIARSLQLHPGDVVLTTDHEYGAMDKMWNFLSKKVGFSYRKVKIPVPFPSPEEIVRIFANSLTGEVKVIFLSQITSPTALIFPVEEISKIAKSMGIFTVIDGAHVPGQLPLNLKGTDFDYYVGNLHKWLCAPKGSAFLFASPAMQKFIEPLVVSWGYEPDLIIESPFIDLLQWTGTRDISAYLSVPAAINYQADRNWDDIRSYCHFKAVQLDLEFQHLLRRPSNYHSPAQYCQMFSVELPPTVDIVTMKSTLYDKYRIEVPLIDWKERKLMRVSLQAYNSDEDCGALLQAVKTILEL
jgi:isopenicillin-N epimerase